MIPDIKTSDVERQCQVRYQYVKTALGGSAGQRGAVFGFLWLGLIGFGGVLPMARSMLVERRRWLNAEQFTELLGLCQFLPGGNVINLSVAVGMEFRGLRGALCALLGSSARRRRSWWAGRGVRPLPNDPMCSMCSPLAAAAAGLLLSTDQDAAERCAANGRRWRSSRWR
ncbi:hypothetical protein SL267_22010 [Serratia marcescens]|nr:chromate transporter [Serratia marcescens]BCZ57584.1 hypothetical protein SL267_22010 [Serratia marcescens]